MKRKWNTRVLVYLGVCIFLTNVITGTVPLIIFQQKLWLSERKSLPLQVITNVE